MVMVYNPIHLGCDGPFPCYILGRPNPYGLVKVLLEVPKGNWNCGLLSTSVDEFGSIVTDPVEW